MNQRNSQAYDEFEGYSPAEMQFVLYDTFGDNSPIQFQKLSEADYKSIPILNQVEYLLKLVDKAREVKLTKLGFLPTKVVSKIYDQGFIKDRVGITKLYKETDASSINLTRLLIELSGLAKKRNGKLSLTKKSEKYLKNKFELLKLIFETFATKFNWAYYDGYGENRIVQLGFGFSIILLSKYGNKKQVD